MFGSMGERVVTGDLPERFRVAGLSWFELAWSVH
jgi:hypothetical protein